MNIYFLFVITFSLCMIGFGLYLYSRREGAASVVGSILSLVGLLVVLIAVIVWLLPGFFFNVS